MKKRNDESNNGDVVIGVCGVIMDSMNSITNVIMKKNTTTGRTELYYQDDCNGYINILVYDKNSITPVKVTTTVKGKVDYTPEYQVLYAVLLTKSLGNGVAVIQLEENKIMLVRSFEPFSGVVADKTRLKDKEDIYLKCDVSDFEPGDDGYEDMITIIMEAGEI